MNLDEAFLEVWRQAMVENARTVHLDGESYAVKRTSRNRLRQIDFEVDGRKLRGLEQNPDTSSRWAQMAREGKKVMQFLREGRYVAVVADGKVFTYSRGS